MLGVIGVTTIVNKFMTILFWVVAGFIGVFTVGGLIHGHFRREKLNRQLESRLRSVVRESSGL